MIDCENEVYTRLAKILREKFPKIDIASEYVKSPSSFPHVSITQSDCYIPTEWQDSSMKENMVNHRKRDRQCLRKTGLHHPIPEH